mgnify:FL=1
MNKVEIIKKFNSIIESLLTQVSPLIGTKYLMYFQKITKMNSLMPIKKFSVYALKSKKQILDKNPDYFLDENYYNKTINEIYSKKENTDWYLSEILHLKTIYLAVDDESKDNIWDILHALVILSEDYIKLN